MRALGLFAAVLLLAACETAPEQSASTSGTGSESAQASAPQVTTAPRATAPQPAGPAPGSQEDLVANVGDRVFFDFDSAVIKPEGRSTLQRQAAWLRRHASVKIIVEGHADERGTREYNLALGERRAAAVKTYLVSLGIGGDRINTISYGKERAVSLGSNEDAWAQNRRGVTVVIGAGGYRPSV